MLLSGALLEVADWPWVFAADAVWAALALAAWRSAPESADRDRPANDSVGAALSAGGLSAVVYATIEGPRRGWSDSVGLAGYAVGAAALAAFVAWERSRSPTPARPPPVPPPRLRALWVGAAVLATGAVITRLRRDRRAISGAVDA